MTDVLTPPVKPGRTELATEQEAREVAEAAREKDWQAPSFVRELFEGSFRLDLVHPFPSMDPADVERARPFMERLERFLVERVDSDRIDREGKIPPDVIQGLRDIGAFGIVVGVSLGGSCRMRFRRYPPAKGAKIFTLELAPRSVYVLRDEIRWRWQHSVARTKELRCSITFRTPR